jgi:hypothetical protein
MNAARRRLRGRYLVAGTGACLLVAGLATPSASAAPSGARAARAQLSVTSLRVSDTSLAAKQRFVVRGRVVNRGRRAGSAQLQLLLRASGNPTISYALGGARVASVRPGRRRSFAVRVSAPTLRETVAQGLKLQVCVRPRRGARTVSCATASRRVRVALPRRPSPRPFFPPPGKSLGPPSSPPPPAPTVYTPGARTLGDSLFTTIGNGGYDATHYDLDLSYTSVLVGQLRGVATIDATATQNLSEFSLDFQSFAVSRVAVDGRLAAFEFDYEGSKLIVTPPAGIKDGTAFTVQVSYRGVPALVIDPDGSSEGWVADPAYGATALGEPMGSQGWFPCNNIPTDKATYDISVTTASDFQSVSNGVLESQTSDDAGTARTDDDTTTYDWVSERPMASYLATVSIGRFDTSGSDLSDPARPLYIYVDRSFTNGPAMIAEQQRVPGILDFYADYYGVPYPFEAAGGIVPRTDVGYALETQTKPTYATGSTDGDPGPDIATIAHENAHQWFGNLVTLARWRDIWLNEGITEFSSWVWAQEEDGGPTTAQLFDDFYANLPDGAWSVAPADPLTAGDIFDFDAMYVRGAATMAAIRQVFGDTPYLGEDAFRAMMRSWLTDHAFGNVTTEQFVELVKAADPTRAARWSEFLDQWLYTSYTGDPSAPGNKPSITPANFDGP